MEEKTSIESLVETHESGEVKNKSRKKGNFSYVEPIVGILFTLVATTIFLGFPQIIAIVYIGMELIPTFDLDVINSLMVPIILWAVFRLSVDVMYLIERSYTRRLKTTVLIGNTLTIITTFIIFASNRIVYYRYVDFIHEYFSGFAAWFAEILSRPNLIVLAVALFVLIFESFTIVKKSARYESLCTLETNIVSKENVTSA